MPIAWQGVVFPLHTGFAMIYFALLFQFHPNRIALFRGALALLPIGVVMLISLAQAHDIPYALKKIEGGVIASLLSATVTAHCVRRYGLNAFLASYINVTLMVLAATLAYRIGSGYELGSRDGRFLINGPITYGWLMGIAAVIGLFLYYQVGRRKYLLYSAIFVVMMVATGSKGPVLAFIFASMIFFILHARSRRILVIALSLVLGIVVALQFLALEAVGRFSALARLISGQLADEDSGSIGVRSMAWEESMSSFKSNYFWGVGLGNWENYSSIKIIYPHNLFFEIASEMGLLGLAAFAMVIFPLLLTRSRFLVMYLSFFLTALSFSGDMSYHRYLLGIPLGLLLERQSRVNREIAG